MRLIMTFIRRYPHQTLLALIALLFAGLVDGFGMTVLLPLMSMAVNRTDGSAVLAHPSESALEKIITDVFERVGIYPTVNLLLVIFVLSIIIKSGLILLANKRVGYLIAQAATDLRLTMMRTLFATRWEYYVHQPIGHPRT